MIDPEVMRRLEQQASLIRQLQGALGGNRVLYGIVDVTAGGASVLEGTGFSVARNAAGDVSITYDTAFSDRPAVACTTIGTAAQNISEHSSSPTDGTGFRAHIYGTATGTASDVAFHFIAIGPS